MNRSSKNRRAVNYGTATRSINLMIGNDIGVATTETTRINESWFKKHIYLKPQFD